MKSIAPFLVMIGILITIAVITQAFLNYRLRKRILDAGPLDDKALSFLNQLSGVGSETLKWGLLLLSGGIGLVIIQYIPYDSDRSPLPYGIESIFLAIGLLAYYFITQKRNHR